MASDKRDFSDFLAMPGTIEDGQYNFPALWNTNQSGKKMKWQVFVRLIKYDGDNAPQYRYDWNTMQDDVVPVTQGYLTGATPLPGNTIAQFWTESGLEGGKVKRHPPSYGYPRNVGRSNERNTLQQALVESRALYLSKINKGYSIKSTPSAPPTQALYFPMLAKEFSKEEAKVTYPVGVQPKLNGVRCMSFYNAKEKGVVMYSRQRKMYPASPSLDAIREELRPVLRNVARGVYLDGEFYVHGRSLQDMNAIRSEETKEAMEYHVFDLYDPAAPDMPFSARYERLAALFERSDIVKVVPMHIARTPKENDKVYKQYLKQRYEGVMIRTLESPYVTDAQHATSKLRTRFLLKRKPIHSAEFQVVGFTPGKKGKDLLAVTWICATDQGKTFHVTPNIPYEERERILKACQAEEGAGFSRLYEGRMMTVEFRDSSNDGIPLQAKAIAFRDMQ